MLRQLVFGTGFGHAYYRYLTAKVLDKMARLLFVIVCFALQYHQCHSQEIEDARLVNGTYGDHMGRVELLINGTWGTICNNRWNYPDARTVCKMMGFITTVCFTHGPTFGDPDNVPVLMRAVYCTGDDSVTNLNNCSYELAGVDETCQDSAGAVCVKRVVGRPSNVSQVDATTTSVTIGFQIPPIPDGVVRLRFRLQLNPSRRSHYCYADNDGTSWFQCTFPDLTHNTTYSVQARVDVLYSVCRQTGYLYGNYSRNIPATTTARAPQPTIEARLVPPRADATFMGRLEVFYNNTWGTVCDDNFQNPEANVVCETLGYPRAMCYVREARFGQGSGPIWMDNLDCTRSHDDLSECDFNGWGVTNCDHDEDVGVVCWPDEYQQPVSGVTVLDTTGSSITLTWEPYTFPPLTSDAGYEVQSNGRISVAEHSETQYTITRLEPTTSYSIRVRARFHFSEYCITRSFRYTQWTNRFTVTTIETAPTAPPSFFHVVVLNSTAVEFQWELPPIEYRNGIIRGFKLFVGQQGITAETTVNVSDPDANEYIVSRLSPATPYVCSMLAYNSADGPRTVYLTVSTFPNDYTPIIINFGINGDGLEKATKQLGSTGGITVHCDAGITNVTINWLFSNGSQVGSTDRSVRQAKYPNGTTILQVANDRSVDYCDAGVYTCCAESPSGESQERKFTLRVNNAPPTPGIIYAQIVGSTWMTVTWTDLACDGGHKVIGRNIRYGKDFENFILPTNMFIFNINASLRQYTIQNLEPSTSYNISIQALSADYRLSSFSTGNIITTLPDAPSPPRSVTVRLVSPSKSLVEVRWREPAAANGIITQYTVLVSGGSRATNDGNGAISISVPEIFNKTYPGHIGAVNITVNTYEVYYSFQVRASNFVNNVQNYGEFSEVTEESTVFIPSPDLPVPRNVQVISLTNSTATLTWDYPEEQFDPINSFLVAYSARVQWYSPQQETLVMLEDSGKVTSFLNRATVYQLTPATNYTFRVSAVVESGERGAEVFAYGATTNATGERLAYFQLRISRVASCYFWQERSAERISLIRDALLSQLNSSLCPSCRISNKTIADEELSCRHGLVDQVVFRARIIGNSLYSASGLVDLLGAWVESGEASIVINSVRYLIDPTCSTSLDSIYAPDCDVSTETTTTTSSPPEQTTTKPSSSKPPSTTMPPTTSTKPPPSSTKPPPSSTKPPPSSTKPSSSVDKLESANAISGGEIGGLIIGVIIALLLLLFIVLLALLLYRSFRSTVGTKPLNNTDTSVIFSDINTEAEFKSDLGNGDSDL